MKERWQGGMGKERWIVGKGKVTVNRHIDIAEEYANNMRLYEATGMGACLVTDAKLNLPCLFDQIAR